MIVVEREARISQAISHAVQRLLILNLLAVIHGPYPNVEDPAVIGLSLFYWILIGFMIWINFGTDWHCDSMFCVVISTR